MRIALLSVGGQRDMLPERSALRQPVDAQGEGAWRFGGGVVWILATLLLVSGGGCAEQAIVVPKDSLPTAEIFNEHIEVEAAAPFYERVELREARLHYPILYGTFVALASSRKFVPDMQVRFPVLDVGQVSLLPRQAATAADTPPPSDGTVRIRVRGAVPLGGYLDLRAAEYRSGQASGTVEAVQPPGANRAAGQRITLDVRRFDQLAVYRLTSGSRAAIILVGVLVPLGLTVGIIAGLVDNYCRQHSPCSFLSLRAT